MIELFRRYDVVGMPELHWNKEVHEFLRGLVADPRLGERGVTNIVVEFGNARLQAVADRYVHGEDVPVEQVRAIWRETGQFLVWDSPLYEQFFRTVREINAQRPRERRWRVLLGDPPLDWPEVYSKGGDPKDADLKHAERDQVFASVVETEVLARHQKALLVVGALHLLYQRNPDERRLGGPSVAELLRRKYPERVFNFWAVNAPIAGAPGSPRAVVVRDTPRGRESFVPYARKGMMGRKVVDGKEQWVTLVDSDWPSLAQMTDGLIYYAPTSTIVEPDPAVYRDAAYVSELRRRAAILDAMGGMTEHSDQLQAVAPH